MSKIILTKTNEYLCSSEEEAESVVAEAKEEIYSIEASSIKFKKATKKKAEHWIVTIKQRVDYADEYISEE